LDTLPLPEFAEMREIYETAEFEVTRGCPYSCVFCERFGMFGNLIRSHSLEYMERLIKHTLSYEFKYYTNIDTALNVDEAKSIKFLQMLKRNKIKFPYQASLRGCHPKPELTRLMVETGCEDISIGVESGDEYVLKSMNKAQDLSILYELISNIAENRMGLMLFLIVGFPTESLESVSRTLQFVTNIHSFAKIDLINMELYHVGHIQALGPHKYEKYGIEWTKPQDLKEIESASRLFLEPGLYGQAKYKYGMDRFQTHTALEMYNSKFKALGIENFVCHTVTQEWADK
ncbi:MAG: radical SAM protein, partial [Candidatus Atribacteria bacterium]|nr:radical SAM protein [Candidatus Atribacteria bacterium]